MNFVRLFWLIEYASLREAKRVLTRLCFNTWDSQNVLPILWTFFSLEFYPWFKPSRLLFLETNRKFCQQVQTLMGRSSTAIIHWSSIYNIDSNAFISTYNQFRLRNEVIRLKRIRLYNYTLTCENTGIKIICFHFYILACKIVFKKTYFLLCLKLGVHPVHQHVTLM